VVVEHHDGGAIVRLKPLDEPGRLAEHLQHPRDARRLQAPLDEEDNTAPGRAHPRLRCRGRFVASIAARRRGQAYPRRRLQARRPAIDFDAEIRRVQATAGAAATVDHPRVDEHARDVHSLVEPDLRPPRMGEYQQPGEDNHHAHKAVSHCTLSAPFGGRSATIRPAALKGCATSPGHMWRRPSGLS